MGKETIRLPSLWLFVGAYVLAVAADRLLPAIVFNGPTEHQVLIGVPMLVSSLVTVAALFGAGYVSRRFELLALPLLVLPLMILFADVIRSIPPEIEMGFEEPLFPVDKELRSALENVLPYNLIVVALGVLAGRKTLTSDGAHSSLPPTKPFAITFASLLVFQAIIQYGNTDQRSWFDFYGIGQVMTLVSVGVLLSLFILVFLLNSGWAVIPTMAIPFVAVVLATIEDVDYMDLVRDSIPYTLTAIGIFVLMTLALSAWCRNEVVQADESDGADAINSTPLPAGSET